MNWWVAYQRRTPVCNPIILLMIRRQRRGMFCRTEVRDVTGNEDKNSRCIPECVGFTVGCGTVGKTNWG